MTNHADNIFYFSSSGYFPSLAIREGEVRGVVQFPEGIVEVVSCTAGDTHPGTTRMEFVFERCVYCREWKTFYSKKHLITLARRFVQDILEDNRA